MFGLAINVLLATAKLLAGLFGHAYVLIAYGIESALDERGSIVIWGGSRGPGVPIGGIHDLHMARIQL
jgi:divalent metal cation (Fe/Co/Zn/Cd) transporter